MYRLARGAADQPTGELRRAADGWLMVDWAHVVDRLADASGYWLATIDRANRPHVVPIWGSLSRASCYLETGDPNTVKNRNLRRNREVAVHTGW